MSSENNPKMMYEDILYDIFKEEDCEALERHNKALQLSETPKFSFMMATYNDTRLLNASINSLLKQDFKDWELIILDNSDKTDQIWQIIQRVMKADKRISGYRSEHNVGWPKAASICLEHVKGEYTTFLAADDVIVLGALKVLNDVLCKESPDILWVGNAHINYNEGRGVDIKAGCKPNYMVYQGDLRSATIAHLMKTVYYNSFFHYMNVDFLRRNNINFFEPFYADCAGMTEAMAVADKMITLDRVVYYLTLDTSQTVGRYTWDSYQFIFANQWKSVKKVFKRERFGDAREISYVAWRIVRNLTGSISDLCQGCCRDKFMNPIEKPLDEIIGQLENIISNEEIAEMLEVASEAGFQLLLKALVSIRTIAEETDDISIRDSWLSSIFDLAVYQDICSMEQQFELIIRWLLEEQNPNCLGFEYFAQIAEKVEDKCLLDFQDNIAAVIDKYKNHMDVENSLENRKMWI